MLTKPRAQTARGIARRPRAPFADALIIKALFVGDADGISFAALRRLPGFASLLHKEVDDGEGGDAVDPPRA
jgi:hypothetical protein